MKQALCRLFLPILKHIFCGYEFHYLGFKQIMILSKSINGIPQMTDESNKFPKISLIHLEMGMGSNGKVGGGPWW